VWADTVCAPIEPCAADEWEVAPPSRSAQRHCQKVRTCNGWESHPDDDGGGGGGSNDGDDGSGSGGSGGRRLLARREAANASNGTNRSNVTGGGSNSSGSGSGYVDDTQWRGPEYETVPPTATSDRECAPVTDCATATASTVSGFGSGSGSGWDESSLWMETAATRVSDSVCRYVSFCPPGTGESEPPTPTSDRVCGPCDGTSQFQPEYAGVHCLPLPDGCGPGFYEAKPPTPRRNITCVAVRECGAGRYIVQPPTATTDTVCATVTTCAEVGVEFEQVPPTATSDRSCGVVSSCNFNEEYMAAAPTNTSDRICRLVTVAACPAGQYQEKSANRNRDRICATRTACMDAVEYEVSPGTATTDRVCAPVSEPCAAGSQFEVAGPSSIADRICRDVTRCEAGTRQLRPPSATADRVCINCNGLTEFQSEGDRTSCERVSACAVGEYQTADPTPSSDRTCAPVSTVRPGFFAAVAATATADLVSRRCATCADGVEYEVLPCTATADRLCDLVSANCPAGQHQTATSSSDSNIVCADHTVCSAAAGLYTARPGTSRSDAVCRAAVPCTAGAYQVSGVCHMWRDVGDASVGAWVGDCGEAA
jgi:hypothetical protein